MTDQQESLSDKTGPITHAEAREIANRYNNSHWGNRNRARYSIPVNHQRDDDIRLAAYIDQQEALTAARQVPPGHVRGSDGVDRKVLGTLPITADGCVAGHGCTVYGWHPDDGKGVTVRQGGVQAWIWHSAKGQNWSTPTDSCYSTREAAQAAQRSKAQ